MRSPLCKSYAGILLCLLFVTGLVLGNRGLRNCLCHVEICHKTTNTNHSTKKCCQTSCAANTKTTNDNSLKFTTEDCCKLTPALGFVPYYQNSNDLQDSNSLDIQPFALNFTPTTPLFYQHPLNLNRGNQNKKPPIAVYFRQNKNKGRIILLQKSVLNC